MVPVNSIFTDIADCRTCQLVLGAGAVSLAGLKTITIRNLAVTLRSLALVAQLVPHLRQQILKVRNHF